MSDDRFAHVVESDLLRELRGTRDAGCCDDDWYWHGKMAKAIDALERLHWLPVEKADDVFYGFYDGDEYLVMCSPADGDPFKALATFTPDGWVVGPERRPLAATVTHVMEPPDPPGG